MIDIRHKVLKLTINVYEECRDTVKETVLTVVDAFKRFYEWHQRLMLTNPAYPIAVLSIGKTLIRVITPSGAIAAAAIALLAAVLDVRNQDPDEGWDHYY